MKRIKYAKLVLENIIFFKVQNTSCVFGRLEPNTKVGVGAVN